jgi:predicted transcriptional regulator
MTDAPILTHADIARYIDELRVGAASKRHWRHLSVRAAAKQIGISFSSLARFEASTVDAQLHTMLAIAKWVDQP